MPLTSNLRAWRAWRAAPAVLAVLGAVLGPASAAAKATPSFYANASPNSTVGRSIFDHTNLSGGASPTGTITFKLYGPGDATCASPVFTTSVAVSGTGSDDSSRYATPRAGTYEWTAAYNGDANNNPAATPCGSPSQAVILDKAGPVEATSVAANAGTIQATASLQGGFAPLTGTITFTVTGPHDTFCSGPAIHTSTVAVNGAGNYASGGFTPTAAGTYTYRIRYDGDINNYGIGPTPCLDQTASITLTQAQLATGGTPPPATGGGTGGSTPPPPAGGGTGGGTITPPPSGGSATPPGAGGGSTTPPSPGGGATTPPYTFGVPGSNLVSTSFPPAKTSPTTTGPTAVTDHAPTSAPNIVFDGPARCVRGPFTVSVAGAGIRRVTYLMHGRSLRTVTRADARGRFRATINPRRLSRGIRQQVTARVASAAGAAVLHRAFSVCR